MTDSPEDFDEEDEEQEVPPGPEVTPELFREWRSPRYGRTNPEQMNSPVWEWLIRARINAYRANEQFDGPSPFDAGPGWCFDRFGQSSTLLPDGRRVLIAGEHEDWYDPDFFIYNDVVVRHPDDRIDIYAYPKDVFPPTDFHTATLVGDQIILIGCAGYRDQCQPGTTPVLTLDLKTFAISQVTPSGTAPGWIYDHTATLSEDGASILIQQGKVEHGGTEAAEVENIDDWRLHLADWRWERLTERKWQQWKISRKDGHSHYFRELESALFYRDRGWEAYDRDMAELTQKFGKAPDLDLVPQIFRPPVPHEPQPEEEDSYRVRRIKVDGVTVRYVNEFFSLRMVVEGELPQPTIDALTADLIEKLSTLENTPYERKQL